MTDPEKQIVEQENQPTQEAKYPLGYFDAQVRFAQKWAEISGRPLAETLNDKTALYRRLTEVAAPLGDGIWNNMLARLPEQATTEQISQVIYDVYLEQPHHVYTPPTYPENDGKHFGFFAFDFVPADPEKGEPERIKVHFINKHRGEKSGLDQSYLPERQADLKRMFQHIRRAYPQAEQVVGSSWLYALQSYRDSFPPLFTANRQPFVPGEGLAREAVPTVTFVGDSVWGQFMDRRGGVRQHVYDQFLLNLEQAANLEDLVRAFPNVRYKTTAPISVFYDWVDATR